MPRYGLLRVLTPVILVVCGISALQFSPGHAQTPPHTPPANIDAFHPTVSGTLVAKPVNGESPVAPACTDRDNGTLAPAIAQRKGLVICTEEGRLILLQLSSETGIYSRYWARRGLDRLTDGDHINAWGVLTDNGYVLDPTFAVQDSDIQEALTDSQDFISESGPTLTMDVLRAPAKGPVQGIIHAVQGGKTSITLCNGEPGSWNDLRTGETVDISRSLFNQQLKTYIHTQRIRVVSCS